MSAFLAPHTIGSSIKLVSRYLATVRLPDSGVWGCVIINFCAAFAVDYNRFEWRMGLRLVLDPRRRGPCPPSTDLTERLASDSHTDKLCLERKEILG